MHIPVLQKEVIKYLDPKTNENFIDCTIGGGGHALAILEKIQPNGKVLGVDWDEEIIRRLKIKNNLILVCDNFANLKKFIKKYNFENISGVLFDLGYCSWHLEESGRGFSFLRNEPLDMRYNIKSKILTAEKIVNEWSEDALERILKEYGEERYAGRIARKIIEARKLRPIKTTFQLVELIKRAMPGRYHYRKISRRKARGFLRDRHPATRTFQALRIAVNDELNNFKKALPQALEALESDGKLVIISFHSLEDRIAKNFFKDRAEKGLVKILTKKPIKPSTEEIKINPRSRSAKLRACLKF